MRIALLARRFNAYGGGTERDLDVTVQSLRAAGHQVRIYAARVIQGAPPDVPITQLVRLHAGRAAEVIQFALSAPLIARRDGAELIISFGRAIGAEVLRSGGGAHAAYLRAARRWAGNRAALNWLKPYHLAQVAVERAGMHAARLRMVVAVSRLVGDGLIKEHALDPAKVRVLYNGVDLERFVPLAAEQCTRIRQGLAISPSDRLTVFVGNGFGRKGLRSLLAAWSAMTLADHLLVVGQDRNRSSYERIARRLGLGGRVRFLGVRHDVEQIIGAADALVLPSLFEPFGNVAMEAMAAGTPPLCSACCGVAEVLPAELAGLVIEHPWEAREIAQRLTGLLERAAELRSAVRAVAQQYTWHRYGEELAALIMRAAGH